MTLISPNIISDIISDGMKHFGKNSEKTFESFFLKKHFGKYCGKDRWGKIETSKPLDANQKDINKEKS